MALNVIPPVEFVTYDAFLRIVYLASQRATFVKHLSSS